MKKLTALLILCLSFYSIDSLAAIDALDFSSAQQEKDYHSLTQELRCPQCQNNNIVDSNASIAVDMRHKVFELLQQGQSKQQIVDYMVARYGNFVTYDPPLTPATSMLWLMPFLLALLGVLMLWRKKPKVVISTESAVKTRIDYSQPLTAEQQERLKQLLQQAEQERKQ